ncbi:MAG TPA: SPOR domain-containing protein [Casimicrobiaceae bacterium]|nr:SPOR domain-containing protein [Casimicrobiaceae bacterium]
MRPYPPRPKTRLGLPRNARGGTLLGIFIGLILGLGLAAGVAYYLGRSGLTTPLPASGQSKDAARGAKGDGAVISTTPEKPRFDFYKILPGSDEPKVGSAEKRPVEKAPERQPERGAPDAVAKLESAQKAGDRLWLQAGAFVNESDAENLKARLALSGWEAVIQSATLPDKSVRYRVRLGPYDNNDQLNRTKNDLGKSGFDVAVIRNP